MSHLLPSMLSLLYVKDHPYIRRSVHFPLPYNSVYAVVYPAAWYWNIPSSYSPDTHNKRFRGKYLPQERHPALRRCRYSDTRSDFRPSRPCLTGCTLRRKQTALPSLRHLRTPPLPHNMYFRSYYTEVRGQAASMLTTIAFI